MKISVKKFIRSSGRVGSKSLWIGIALNALLTGSLMTVTQAQAQTKCLPKMPLLTTVRVSSFFGPRIHPIRGGSKFHKGMDLATKLGTPIYATDEGTVVAKFQDAVSGNAVWILNNSGITTHYYHSNRLFVEKGQLVKAGQQIAEVGTTGASTGAHLHFEVVPKGQGMVDPQPYLCTLQGVPGSTPKPPYGPIDGSVATGGIPNNDYPPMGSSQAAMVPISNPATQASSMGDYAGKSLHEFLSQESSRRFNNPQWLRDLADPKDNLRNDPDPAVRATAEGIPVTDVKPMIWREIIFMMSLKDFYKMEKHDRNQRIENLLATDLSERVNDYSTKLLETLRTQAASR